MHLWMSNTPTFEIASVTNSLNLENSRNLLSYLKFVDRYISVSESEKVESSIRVYEKYSEGTFTRSLSTHLTKNL